MLTFGTVSNMDMGFSPCRTDFSAVYLYRFITWYTDTFCMLSEDKPFIAL